MPTCRGMYAPAMYSMVVFPPSRTTLATSSQISASWTMVPRPAVFLSFDIYTAAAFDMLACLPPPMLSSGSADSGATRVLTSVKWIPSL